MMIIRRFAAALAVVLSLAGAAHAQQSTLVPPGVGSTDMAALRTYLTNAFYSTAACFYGATAPAVGVAGAKIPYQCWNDTSASPTVVHRIWNNSTSTWIAAWSLDITANTFSVGVSSVVNAQTGTTYTVADADRGKLIDFCNVSAVAVTQPQAGAAGIFSSGWYATYRNSCAGTVTITPTTSTVDGGATIVLKQYQSATVRSDGTNYKSTFRFLSPAQNLADLDSASTARTNLGLAIGTNVQAYSAILAAYAGLSPAADKCAYFTGAAAVSLIDCLSWSRSVTSAATVGAGRTAFGLAIGTDVQAYSANLAAVAGLTSAADKCSYWTGSATAAVYDCLSWARSVISAANAGAGRTAFGLAIGSDVQAYSAILAAYAGLSPAADKCAYFTGAAAVSLIDCLSWSRSVTSAATVGAGRTAFGLAIGTDVQAYNAILAAYAGLSPAADKCAYFTGAAAVALIDCKSWARTFIASADVATARGSAGLNVDGATSTGDANYTILTTDRLLYHTALSAARTDTLPAANAVNPGQAFIVSDFRGVADATKTITLQRAGSDTINGVTSIVAINAQYGAGIFWSDGSSRWTYFPAGSGGGAGTVTSVVCGTGLDGGTITSTGTCSLSAARRTLPTSQTLTSGTAATYTTPASALWLKIRFCGAGGGGGGATGTGGTGGTTSFNSVTAVGGSGGVGASGNAGGVGGTGGTGTAQFRISGSRGMSVIAIGASAFGGVGAASAFAGGGSGAYPVANGGDAPANSCAGGGGSANGSGVAGSGGGSGEYAELIVGSPAGTYTYTVGAAGTAGSGTQTGGLGGAGMIIVEEHYNFLLKRDLNPANENSPMWLNAAA